MPRSGKLPVLNLLRPKIIAPIQFKLDRADGHLAPLVCSKFHLNRHRGWEYSPQNIKFPLSGKSRLTEQNPLTDFQNF